MKKILLSLIILLAIWLSWQFINSSTQKPSPSVIQEFSSITTLSPTPVLKQTTEVTIAGKNYRVSWIKVNDINRLSLFSNLAEKKTAEELRIKYKCENLINAGFYDKSNHHLGLFISDHKIVTSELTSTLFNGFFFITTSGLIDITATIPYQNMRLALQSGPLLWKDASPLVLRINNDELARRMLVLITSKREVYFLAIFDQDSPLQGPYLEDLPNLILQFQTNTGVAVGSALNLDGGSASAFYTNDISLTEINPIGSFFCEK